MDKKDLSEQDICTKYIVPALQSAGWDIEKQIREQVSFTKGRIIVKGKTIARGEPKRIDFILYYKANTPIALIEAKDKHAVGDGMQQTLNYAESLEIPFVFSSNGDAFLEHDKTIGQGNSEQEIPLEAFPTPDELVNYLTLKVRTRVILDNGYFFVILLFRLLK